MPTKLSTEQESSTDHVPNGTSPASSRRSAMVIWGVVTALVTLAYIRAAFTFIGSTDETKIAGQGSNAIWLANMVWMAGTLAYGLLIVILNWDRRFRWATEWNTWLFLGAILFSLASFAVAGPILASIGLWLFIASFACSHFEKQTSQMPSVSLSSYAFVGIGFLLLPTSVISPWFELVELALAQSTRLVLSLSGIPFQYLDGTFLTEAGDVEIASAQVGLTFRVIFLFTLFWVARRSRSWLALPLYTSAALLWSIAVAQSQLFFQIAFANQGSSGLGLTLFALFGLAVAAALMASTDRLLRVLLFEIPADSVKRKNNPVIHLWNRSFESMTIGNRIGVSNQ